MLVFKRNPQPIKPKAPTSLHDVMQERTYEYLKEVLPAKEAQAYWLAGQKIHDLEQRTLFYAEAVQRLEQEYITGLKTPSDYVVYKHKPVGVEEFICSPHYLNKEQEIYPEVLKAAVELNNGAYTEAVLTGGIGSGKTTLGLHTNAYQLYLLSCMRSPHKTFGLDPSSEILLIFQSITKQLAQGVDYQRFRSMIEGSPYFQQHYPIIKKDLEAKLVFPNRIEVIPVSGAETAAIGQNVMGGMIDELNYMAVVEKSKVSADKGTYDQAISLYNSISRRRKSRFMNQGKLPGILCLVSSKKYPGQFTDQKMEEAKRDPTIFVYDKRVWDIKPNDFGQSGWFNVFVGDMTRKPRILVEDEQSTLSVEDRETLVVPIPLEYREEFGKDIINALREIAGVSTLARHPFFLEVDKVAAAFHKDQPSIFSRHQVDFVTTKLTLVKGAIKNPEIPRFAHVDLGISGDSAGIAIGTVVDFTAVSKTGETTLYMPQIRIDGVLEVKPPKNSEILFSKIREVFLVLQQMGMYIRWITFDQFQSTDSQQILRQAGFLTGHQSVDEVPCRPYDFTKTAMYEGRITLPYHPHVQKEILMLEKDMKTGKIDHPPGGSKDCADAVAGVVYGLTMRREMWGWYKIPIALMPSNVVDSRDKMKSVEQQPEYQTKESLGMERHRTRRPDGEV